MKEKEDQRSRGSKREKEKILLFTYHCQISLINIRLKKLKKNQKTKNKQNMRRTSQKPKENNRSTFKVRHKDSREKTKINSRKPQKRNKKMKKNYKQQKKIYKRSSLPIENSSERNNQNNSLVQGINRSFKPNRYNHQLPDKKINHK